MLTCANIIIHPQVLHQNSFLSKHLYLGPRRTIRCYLFNWKLIIIAKITHLLLLLRLQGKLLCVIIDTFGLLGAHQQSFTLFKGVGIVFLITGIIFMNYVRRHPVNRHKNTPIVFWLLIGFVFGFAPPIKQQSTALAQHTLIHICFTHII